LRRINTKGWSGSSRGKRFLYWGFSPVVSTG